MLSTNHNNSTQLWGLMDCNNFYASCERIFRPDLHNRPIVVLSNNDGCIVARSAEAKALGIGMGVPEFQVRNVLKQHNVAVFSSNYALYGDISNRVMQVAETVTPDVEQYSIDEAFLPFTGAIRNNAWQVALTLRERILRWTGISVSIGLGPTKTLAKLANLLAKQKDGIFIIPSDKAEQDNLLSSIAVEKVWGIGRRHAAKLHLHGVSTAKALRDKDNAWLQKKLSITGLHTALELRGIACMAEEQGHRIRQTLVSSRSFGVKIYKKDDLAEAISTFTANAVMRLRREKLFAKGLAVSIRSAKHAKNADSSYAETVHMNVPEPTDDTSIFMHRAMRGLDAIFKEGIAYAKAGVMLYDICPAGAYQTNLLSLCNPKSEQAKAKAAQLMHAMDAINAKHGRHTLKYAGEGLDQAAPWRMRQKFLSGISTTALTKLPVAVCR